MNFAAWLESFSYLSIGHNFDGNFDSYVLKRNSDSILLASKMGENPESFHDHYPLGLDFKGRIDHDKKMVSVITEGGSQQRLDDLIKLLNNQYPDYEIWYFGFGHPKKLK